MILVPNLINQTNTFIGGWQVESDLFNNIITSFEKNQEKQVEAHSVRGYTMIHDEDLPETLQEEYETLVYRCIQEYTTLYPHAKETMNAFEMQKPYNIQRYSPGKFYSAWHCENNGQPDNKNRHLAFLTYLNDVKEGGETAFLHQRVKVKPKQGLTLVWPAHWTHIHRGIPAPNETKYMVTGWMTFKDNSNFLDDINNMSDDDFYNSISSNVV